VSADSTKVVPIFGYFQNKRFSKALEHLSCAYEANLDAEQAILEALIQIGWEDDKMTLEERIYCDILKGRAEIFKHSGQRIRKIMRDIAGYEDSGESSED
jgi:hypothetical protein